jgi:hypothetical protein
MRARRFRVYFPIALTLLLLTAFLSLSCVAEFDGSQYRYRTNFERSYSLKPGGTLTVKNVDGYVNVVPWDKNEVAAKGVLRIRAKDDSEAKKLAKDISVVVSHDENSVYIEIKKKSKTKWQWSFGCYSWTLDLDLNVPRECNLDLSTVDGSVAVTGVKGTVDASTVDGSIEVTGVRGDVTCSTVDGSCHVREVEGRVHVDSTDGSVDVQGKLLGLKARAIDGGIRVTAEEGSVNTDGWTLSTVDGSIVVKIPDSVAGELTASSVDGSVSLYGQADYVVKSSRKVIAKLGKGGAPVKISTTEGSVTVEFGER